MIRAIQKWIREKKEKKLKKIIYDRILKPGLIEAANRGEIKGMLFLKYEIFEIAQKTKTSPFDIAIILQEMIEQNR